MKKVAVTGANGFVGSRLTAYLLEKGYEVSGLIRKSSDRSLLPPALIPVVVDYSKQEAVREALSGCNFLIHNAALTRALNWQSFQKVNVDFTGKLVEIANSVPSIERIIYISSQAAAGPAPDLDSPLTEDDPPSPLTMYGKSKLLAEKLVREKSLKPFTIIRPTSVFGPGDKDFLVYFKLVKRHISFKIGKYPQYISLIYVNDLVKLISLTIEREEAVNQVFFAGYGHKTSLKEFTAYLEQVTSSFTNQFRITLPLLRLAGKIADLVNRIRRRSSLISEEKFIDLAQTYWLVDPSKARDLLGFEPDYDILEALYLTYNWYRERGWL